ncbi:MAG TPA: 30S ribosomal protein S18 [Acidobacteriaceae bacterium]|jgi:small subunit ribosomal protein S18|nr:30S ribosomal protein S18 [Acidobacteriaceae bacterium]
MADETQNQAAPAPAGDAPQRSDSPQRSDAPRAGGYQGGGSDRPRSSGPRPPRPAGGPGGGPGGRKFFRRKKVCKFTVEKIDSISYRDVRLLQQFVSDRGKIIPRRLTGTSAPFQRKLTKAIKQARAIALLPYAAKY